MSFYTSVVRYGNSMLYRGYDSNGKRVTRKENFSPKFYIPAKKDTGWYGLDGVPVGSVSFENMREARNWLEKYNDVEGFNVYGATNFMHQYITSKFPRDIDFDRQCVDVVSLDIETDYDDGFQFQIKQNMKY